MTRGEVIYYLVMLPLIIGLGLWIHSVFIFAFLGFAFLCLAALLYNRAPRIWNKSYKAYKKSKSKYSFWTKPSYEAYLINRYLFSLLLVAVSAAFFYLSYLMAHR